MPNIKKMPKEQGIDHSLDLVREGYLYIVNRTKSFNANIFETRLLGKKAICMVGQEAAELFYDTEKFVRKGAAPNRVVQTLFGKNGVQALDGQEHKHRKEMFMSLMSADELKRLQHITKKHCEEAIRKWGKMDELVLYEETKEILCRTACEWAGVPVQGEYMKNLTNHLSAMFESPGAIGPNHWRGRNARDEVEKWMIELIKQVRQREVTPPENTALYRFSWHLDQNGDFLDTETAAVEVINIIRPIVAIAIYINFVALAIHHYPKEREKLKSEDEKYVQMFIQEVRRFYPFFPFVVAKVKKDFTWNGYQFKEGTLTILDLYGTNHNYTIWDKPDEFNPSRFADWQGSPFAFIPQGGGDYMMGHRCAGEWVTIEVLKVFTNLFVSKIDYEVPEQDLSYSMVKVPSIPHSKFIIKNVRQKM